MPATWSQVLLHIVFATKHRHPWLTPPITERLYPFIGGIIRDERGALLAIGGMPDHLHLLVRWGTDAGIGDLAPHVKSRSSAWIHRELEGCQGFAWQEGYGVFSVSVSNRDSVERYIRDQTEHHRGRTFTEALEALLRKHGVEYGREELE